MGERKGADKIYLGNAKRKIGEIIYYEELCDKKEGLHEVGVYLDVGQAKFSRSTTNMPKLI